MSINDDDIADMIEDCEKRESMLSDWEREFIDSIGERLSRGRSLTTRQIETLESIWDRVTA